MARKQQTKKKQTKGPQRSRKKAPAKAGWELHVISDATGNLARHMITPILTQFPDVKVEKKFHPFITSLEKLEQTLHAIDGPNALVLHALVNPDAKRLVRHICVPRQIPHLDLTRQLVEFLAETFAAHPANELTRLHQIDASYFRRIEAMEFTQNHDDGQGLDTLGQADIVIVGLSRVSKSPTSMFLASLGYKTANVSISPETGFPRQLSKVKKKIIALTLQPKSLQAVRAARLPEVQDTPYHDLRAVIREVMEAETEYRKRGYAILDITGLTIEQTAANIIEMLGLKE